MSLAPELPHPLPADAAAARSAVQRLVAPRSVVVVGGSARPEALGNRVVRSLVDGGFPGEIHVLGRRPATIHGLSCVASFDELPDAIDLALLAVPSDRLLEAVDSCAARHVGAAVCFASGFAELGADGVRHQEEIARRARAGGVRLLGPNCFGLLNAAGRLSALLAPMPSTPVPDPEHGPGVAVISQSGGLGTLVASSLGGRGVPISHLIATGNEADLGLTDLLEYLADDESTGAVAVYAEQIRDPGRFLRAMQIVHDRRKAVVLLHPGRRDRARAAMESHTGALAGDHSVMVAIARRAGVLVVDTTEELIDLAQLMLRFPTPPHRGVGVITQSGAICAIVNDAAEDLELDLPELSPAAAGTQEPPPVNDMRNPLDLGTGTISDPMIIGKAAERILADPAIGSLLVSNPDAQDPLDSIWLETLVPLLAGSAKPIVYVSQNEADPPAGFRRLLLDHRVVFHRSPERALRALARATEAGARRAIGRREVDATARVLPSADGGVHPEWAGKQLLRQLGVPVPDGALARTEDEAVAVAERIGYPVVAKAQSAALSHKSDAGGVVLSIADADAVRTAWTRLHEGIARAKPGLTLDGVLIERMSAPGIELVVGARRDPQWGPVVMVGAGGVLVELLEDVRLLPPDLPEPAIADEICRLRVAWLLGGYRGGAPSDIAAAAHVAALVSDLVLATPEITEIDINPLVVFPEGQGVVALDALVTTARRPR
ncbi:acetate--CoA ligase family protein [Actinoplanes sp. NBRC 103695]|uniref:acetate--CoA ligase family protein n=1 Tax=Actinoplanes sp. NBRC 103695 TaxID=3032202 RepID=UPI0024A0068B|nr:acetate--CoA ligase family protein [Actinoplanes sp. NBRC 103695]GLY97216.1 6-carboxyhexanoate--CoA ligase [Actinoplanes sp. NBRC 103695]